ncbi:hypothetical protein C8R43DRAFT_248683 [Mycena crocata]|nr:hypothetical protein C8R43DRAFT_248683 [Mycena crocata]
MSAESALPPAFTASRLPPDLERIIFEIFALECLVSIPILMRVAWRVKHWVEPMLYHTVLLTGQRTRNGVPHCSLGILMSAIGKMPSSFFRNNVRNLYLNYPSNDVALVQSILTACSEVTNLAIASRIPIDLVPALGALPLRRLVCCIGWLFHDLPLDFTHPIFRHITHLTLVDIVTDYDSRDWEKIVDIPHLTHLALHTHLLAYILLPVLLSCARLECVVFAGSAATHTAAREADVRFVVAPSQLIADWQAGTQGAEDHWSRAEAVIAARRADDASRQSPD